MPNINCGDCPYQFRKGVILDCQECLDEDEAQEVDVAERENHRREVEGEV